MVDFSRAEKAKNHRASFFKASDNVILYIEQLKNEYQATWEKNEVIRKQRAAIVEDTIQFLKSNKIKLTKQLGRCNNEELNKELVDAINSISDKEVREKIQINLIKINNRFEVIQEFGSELDRLMQTLSHYRVPEDDIEDEIVITMPKKETLNATTEETPVELVELPKEPEETTPESEINASLDTEGLEKVINIKDASKELVSDLSKVLDDKKSKRTEAVQDDDIHYFKEEDIFNTNELSSIQDEVDYITSDTLETEIYSNDKVVETNEEFILFTIDDNMTLKGIAQNVYQDEENWIYLYNYGNNANKIDRKVAEFNVSVEEIASLPKYLSGVTLEFPTVLVAKENVEEAPMRRAA
ncbi:MAG: hypothetical protein J1F35_07970 [Erysipelotrichales bacterium]|nr:hypothetical protein [Erysipelotrichales bacterium]